MISVWNSQKERGCGLRTVSLFSPPFSFRHERVTGVWGLLIWNGVTTERAVYFFSRSTCRIDVRYYCRSLLLHAAR